MGTRCRQRHYMTESKKYFEKLRHSPMFQLSLCSKELFHSNFLYWMWSVSPVLFRNIIMELFRMGSAAVSTVVWPEKYIVKREHKNYDLCVTDAENNVFLVIENKVKSIPRLEQLKNYKTKSEMAAHLLLSLADEFPDKDEIVKEWTVVNYKMLSMALKKLLPDAALGSYQTAVLLDYADMIESLHQIQKQWTITDTQSFYFRDKRPDELRIGDLKEKYRFSSMCIMLTNMLKDLLHVNVDYNTDRNHIFGDVDSATKIYVNFGMTRAQGLLEAKIRVEPNLILLVQIQGNQYRHCIELNNTSCDAGQNWKKCSVHKDARWFLYDALNDKSNHQFMQGFMHNEYNKYGSEFLYRYVTISDDASIVDVLNNVVTDCKEILNRKTNTQESAVDNGLRTEGGGRAAF